MTEIRLKWEPENKTPLNEIEERFTKYLAGKKSGISLLRNGTLVFSDNNGNNDDKADARRAMLEARFLTSFKVNLLKEGGFLVTFHDAIAVFVGEGEFYTSRAEIIDRIDELKFLDEEILYNTESTYNDLLIGLYARGKLQKDAYNFEFYKRING
ncbi:hypothetical protein MMO38_04735 [Acinetobacter sp. NIPH 1852]|uniref:hypothetical protein n=1 Tax=Acinetobacter sp. NIPH 1852 TaxID=2923428 RepID=UPI001F4B7E3A|nr:hypothetical protein [Acinetobacter sp. NIPH 1852]MCH7307454.1 hypothetical protein [Acinetobacter sp. NIPH 1852]